MNSLKKFKHKESFTLETGEILSEVEIGYHTYGRLNEAKDNVIWVCHALTGDSDVFSWWSGLFGTDNLFNPKDHFIVCANFLGSPYGSSHPLSQNPKSKEKYYHDFPSITIRDIVKLHKILANELNIDRIELLIGGSMGGHQALEWAIMEPKRIVKLGLIATSAVHSPWGVAFNASQRMAISTDPSWVEAKDDAGKEGIKVARSIALLSYRNYETYENSQKEDDADILYPKKAVTYQKYQGEKLAKRFNAFSYWTLSKAMDSMNVGRQRGNPEKALALVEAKTLIISMTNDLLFPISDQDFLAKHIKNTFHTEVHTSYGHDGFLLETSKISKVLKEYFFTNSKQSSTPKESKKISIERIGIGHRQ